MPAAGRHRLPGRALSRRAAARRSRRSTRCSAPARCPDIVAAHRRPATSATATAAPDRIGAVHAHADSRRTVDAAPSTSRSAPRTELPTYIYDADTPRRARHAAALRVREDRRRLRLQVRLLHHPDAARPLPQPRRPTRSSREARALAARGVKELLLISQDTTFYGIDRGERGALARLLRELNAVDGLEWIRLLYLYPTTIDDDDARRDGGVREGLQVHRPAAAARLGRRC